MIGGPPDHAAGPRPALPLGGVRLRVFRALQNEQAKLAHWYQVGCELAGESERAEHLVLAAHEIREIIEKLMTDAVAPYQVTRQQLGDAVGGLKQHWPDSIRTRSDGDWPPEELEQLRPFLTEAQYLFAPDSPRPFKERELATFLDVRDPIPTAGEVEAKKARDRLGAWKGVRDYFVGVCHHRFSTTIEDFERHLSEFDNLMLALLGPQIFPEQAEVDRLLREAEGAD